MKYNRKLIVLYAAAFVVLLAGIFSTIITVSRMPAYAKKIESKTKVFLELRDLEHIWHQRQSAVRAFDLLKSDKPESLNTLAASHFTGAPPETRVIESTELPDGWIFKRVEIVCGDLNLAQLPLFLHAAETERPPWRLAECGITASRREGGYGRVRLIMEALIKK